MYPEFLLGIVVVSDYLGRSVREGGPSLIVDVRYLILSHEFDQVIKLWNEFTA